MSISQSLLNRFKFFIRYSYDDAIDIRRYAHMPLENIYFGSSPSADDYMFGITPDSDGYVLKLFEEKINVKIISVDEI